MLSLLLFIASTQDELEGRLQKLREVQAGMRREIEKVENDIRKTEAELGGRRGRDREPRGPGREEGPRPEGGNEIQQLRREIAELREMVQGLARRGGGEEPRRPQGRPDAQPPRPERRAPPEGEGREYRFEFGSEGSHPGMWMFRGDGPGMEGFRERMKEFGPQMRERMEDELRKRIPELRERFQSEDRNEAKPRPRILQEDRNEETPKPRPKKNAPKPEKKEKAKEGASSDSDTSLF